MDFSFNESIHLMCDPDMKLHQYNNLQVSQQNISSFQLRRIKCMPM